MKSLPASLLTHVILLLFSVSVFASQELDTKILELQHRWAKINYQLEGKNQFAAFETLVNDAASACKQFPDAAPIWIWSGIIKSSYAGAKGGLGALSLAKKSKADLERALTLDPEAMQGSAYTSLGALYANVPGWPIGFGDDKKAEQYLRKAIALNPTGIDSNYFYADYLHDKKRYKEAKTYLLKAQAAPPRKNRPLADMGRQNEIKRALSEVNEQLNSR